MIERETLRDYSVVVFDADDTLRRTIVPGRPCPRAPGEWVLRPGVRQALSRVPWRAEHGPRLGLASNQDQVAHGLISLEMARRLLRDLAIAATGSAPGEPALQLCPHAADAGCECRKPRPGMLHRIMAHYGVGPDDTVFVGNGEVDREAAARAGVRFVWAADLFGE
jgi:D-glycero-D-manno-heptose 1,7-bisphosphate phosphatase